MPLLFWRLPRIFLLLLNKAQDLFLLPTKPQGLPPGHLALRLVWHCHLCGTPSMRSASCPHYVWMSLFPALHMAGSFSSFAFSWMLQTQKCLPKNVFPFIPPVSTTSLKTTWNFLFHVFSWLLSTHQWCVPQLQRPSIFWLCRQHLVHSRDFITMYRANKKLTVPKQCEGF